MAAKESNVWKRCLLEAARRFPAARIFRNNVGSGWLGPGFTMRPGQVYQAEGGERLITRPQLVDFGLMKGSGDGIGWHSIEITPEMVGQRVAVFVSLEAKAEHGRASKDQINWLQQVHAAGGIAVIVSDPDQLNLEIPIGR